LASQPDGAHDDKIECFVPLRLGQLLEPTVGEMAAGIRHENVKTAETAVSLFHERIDLLGFREVGLDSEYVNPRALLDLRAGAGQNIETASADRHPVARFCQM
jgi:hypothetical protein